MANGTLAIAFTSGEIRELSPAGALVEQGSIGEAADSEPVFLSGLWEVDGSRLGVFDQASQRLCTFSSLAQLHCSNILAGGTGAGGRNRRLKVSGFLGSDALVALVEPHMPSRPGVTRSREAVLIRRLADPEVIVVDTVAGPEIYVGKQQRGFLALGIPPFQYRPLIASVGDLLVEADNKDYNIRLLNRAGRLLKIVRADVTPQRATQSDYKLLAEKEHERAAGSQLKVSALMSLMKQTSLHQTMPVLEAILPGSDSTFWVEELDNATTHYRRVAAYALDGSLRGAFLLSSAVDLLDVRQTRAVVLRRERNGDAEIQVLRLEPLPRK